MKNARGFTLIELMTVLIVIGILLALAYPAYEQYVVRARRTDAKNELQSFALAQERFFTNCNRFATAIDGSQSDCTGLGGASATPLTDNGHYRISLAGDGTTFTFTATPQGVQAKDAQCANFTLDDAGTRGVSGTLSPSECWAR